MTLAAKFEEATRPRERRCKLGQLMLGLEASDLETLHSVLADRVGYSSTIIASVLRLEGHDIGDTTVKAHRAGTCHCGNR